MGISAIVQADSVGPWGSRLTTVLCHYPLIIHNEVMTHRDFSRNAASSRAIPVQRMIQDVLDDPFIPHVWTRNEPGMQGYQELAPGPAEAAKLLWLAGMREAVQRARLLTSLNVHKQIVNRVLMPYMWITVLITSARWGNFFALRLHKTAEPHMRILADRIYGAMRHSTPRRLKAGEWHLPLVGEQDIAEHGFPAVLKLSVARCASTSYRTVDGFDMTMKRANVIHDSLVGSFPVHASPAEHQAQASPALTSNAYGNFGRGWVQYRKTLPGEYITDEQMAAMADEPDWTVSSNPAQSEQPTAAS